MKKIAFAAMAIMAFGLMSCENDASTIRDELSEEVRWYSGEFNVDCWTRLSDTDGLNGYYKADVRIPNLNYSVLRGGQVNCYLFVGKDAQAPLPYVRHYENGSGQRWTRTIDYEYYDGGVTVYVTDSDFAGDVPEAMSFRIMLAW